MSDAKLGDKVSIHYTGTLSNGTQFDSSEGGEPLSFVLGSEQIIPGFSEAVVGMSIGENKTVTIPAAKAYGDHNPEMVQDIPRSNIPKDIELSDGMALTAQSADGQPLQVTVVSFDDEKVTLDGNHPLAGKELTFDLELFSIG